MQKKCFGKFLFMILLLFLLLPFSDLQAKKKVDIVGKEASYFTLPSTHDRLITYTEEFYGKHHLIITFFPAAFTPV
jgi:hypothetical protein